jgi:hypothetical protein
MSDIIPEPKPKKIEPPSPVFDTYSIIENVRIVDDGEIVRIGNGLTIARQRSKVIPTEDGRFQMVMASNPNGFTQASIDFTPNGNNQKAEFGKQIDTMLDGALSLIKLVGEIENGNIESDYFIGQTNDSMANFCLGIGFKHVSNFQNRVYISKSGLLKNKNKILEKLNRILTLKNRKAEKNIVYQDGIE